MALGVSKSSARVVITVDLVSASLKKYKNTGRQFVDGAEPLRHQLNVAGKHLRMHDCCRH